MHVVGPSLLITYCALEIQCSVFFVSISNLRMDDTPGDYLGRCEQCGEPSICYPSTDRGCEVFGFYCVPCWHRCFDGVDLTAACVALGETVWCDEQFRPFFFGTDGLLVSVLCGDMGSSAGHKRDIGFLNALARLCSSTPPVQWANNRLWCRKDVGHRWCFRPILPLGSAYGTTPWHRYAFSPFYWESTGDASKSIVKAALCPQIATLNEFPELIGTAQIKSAIAATYAMGNYAVASALEAEIIRRHGESRCPTIIDGRMCAACVLGDNTLFNANISQWSPPTDLYMDFAKAIDLACMHQRMRFFDALVVKGARVTIDTVDTCVKAKVDIEFVKHVLHTAAIQEHGTEVKADQRPQLTVLLYSTGAGNNTIVFEVLDSPQLLELVLEYGANPEVPGGANDGTAVQEIKALLFACPDDGPLQESLDLLLRWGAENLEPLW